MYSPSCIDHSNHARLLKAYLKRSGMTQQQLAQRIGVSQSYVWQWLAGRRRVAPERAAQLEQSTAGALTRRDFYPDLFN